MKRLDLLVSDLCEEVDFWKDRAESLEKELEIWKEKHRKSVSDSIHHSHEMMAGVVKLVLTKDMTPVNT